MNVGKLKKFSVLAVLALPLVVGCGGPSASGDTSDRKITIWVGDESVEYYQKVCDKYIEDNPNYGFTIQIVGTDLGSISGTILKDSSACGDIYSVAHDNIGKLVQHGDAKPILTKEGQDDFIGNQLVAQIETDSSVDFQKVCKSDFYEYTGSGSEVAEVTRYAAVPYISQALFLMYDKTKVTEEQAQSFEGLLEAARAQGEGVHSVTVVGTDTFNMSFGFLARTEELHDGQHTSSFRLYEDFDKSKTWVQGDDMVSIYNYLKRFKADPNGFAWQTSANFDGDLKAGAVLSVIGGSWKYKTAYAAICIDDDGTEHPERFGIAKIPTMTITEEDAFGTCEAGTVYRGGTFADCKVMMINSHSKPHKYEAILEIMKHLSSTEIQKGSFAECLNTPAYSNFGSEIDEVQEQYHLSDLVCDLARAQVEMVPYGIPQPINTALLNNFFYSSGAGDILKGIVDNSGNVSATKQGIQKQLYIVNYIWIWGKKPQGSKDPGVYPADPNNYDPKK